MADGGNVVAENKKLVRDSGVGKFVVMTKGERKKKKCRDKGEKIFYENKFCKMYFTTVF